MEGLEREKLQAQKKVFWQTYLEALTNPNKYSAYDVESAFCNLVVLFPDLTEEALARIQVLRESSYQWIIKNVGTIPEEIIKKLQQTQEQLQKERKTASN